METGLPRRTARSAFYDVAASSRPRYGRITNVGHVAAAPCREERRLLGDVALLYLPVGVLVRLSGLPPHYRAIKDPAYLGNFFLALVPSEDIVKRADALFRHRCDVVGRDDIALDYHLIRVRRQRRRSSSQARGRGEGILFSLPPGRPPSTRLR